MNINGKDIDKFIRDEDYDKEEKFHYDNNYRDGNRKKFKRRREKKEWKRYKNDAY
jgi:hypothetical protein